MSLLCDAQISQLVVIDIQERLAAAIPTQIMTQVKYNTGIILQSCKKLELPVIRTEQYPQGLGKTEQDITAQLLSEQDIAQINNWLE